MHSRKHLDVSAARSNKRDSNGVRSIPKSEIKNSIGSRRDEKKIQPIRVTYLYRCCYCNVRPYGIV